jgi:ATP-dependent Clp protease protease subunit
MYVEHTSQTLDVIENAMERDKYMTASEAKDFGLIDEVVTSRPPLSEATTTA